MNLRLDFNLILGAPLVGVPKPEYREGKLLPPPPPEEGKTGIQKIPQTILLNDETGIWTGVYLHPIWGEVPASEVSVSENHIAFSAPSGNDDKDGKMALFNFAFVRVDSTDNVVGFVGGQSPFFRSFLMAEGKVTEQNGVIMTQKEIKED